MDCLNNDCVICIIDELEYLDLLNLSETCKNFESIRLFTIFRKKKNRFHDFNRQFIHKQSFISIDKFNVAQKKSFFVSGFGTGVEIKYDLLDGFFLLLGYKRLKFPFIWPLHIWNNIKFRFRDFNVSEIMCPHFSYAYYNFSPNTNTTHIWKLKFLDEPVGTEKYFIKQIQMLYHVFKYFEKDIIEII